MDGQEVQWMEKYGWETDETDLGKKGLEQKFNFKDREEGAWLFMQQIYFQKIKQEKKKNEWAMWI